MSGSRNRLRPGVAAGVAVALIVALLVGAVAFAIARRTANVAQVGTVAIYEEASLSAAAATRNRVVQAHLMARAAVIGVATEDDVVASVANADQAVAELAVRVDRLADELAGEPLRDELMTLAADFAVDAQGAIEAIRGGDLDGAGTGIETALEYSYEALADTLAIARNEAVTQMSLSRDAAGRLGDAASFVVALLLPISFLLVYRARVKNQQRRRDLEASLEKQHAIAKTKDEFIANLSHELRTPLTGIYGFALELIDSNYSHDPAMTIELARLIAEQSAELSRMVEDLLTAATAEHHGLAINEERVDPAQQVAAVLEPLSATGIIATAHCEASSVHADALRLRQIVRNLVSNAHRHGGPNIRVLGRIVGGDYVIEVRDNGKGVSADLEHRLFTRFVHEGTTPILTGSVGLGLAIARLLTENMNGRISYLRDQGETVFSVTFPIARSDQSFDRPENADGNDLDARSFIAGLQGEDATPAIARQPGAPVRDQLIELGRADRSERQAAL